jgi:hypothetical protein
MTARASAPVACRGGERLDTVSARSFLSRSSRSRGGGAAVAGRPRRHDTGAADRAVRLHERVSLGRRRHCGAVDDR